MPLAAFVDASVKVSPGKVTTNLLAAPTDCDNDPKFVPPLPSVFAVVVIPVIIAVPPAVPVAL